MNNLKDTYKEVAARLQDEVPALKWIDLWHDQVNFLETEHPFPTPAAFLSFRFETDREEAKGIQRSIVQLEVYLFFETFLDTYQDAWNQDEALEFLDILDDINKTLHGWGCPYLENLQKTGGEAVDTGNAGNLYRLRYTGIQLDDTAFREDDFVNADFFIHKTTIDV